MQTASRARFAGARPIVARHGWRTGGVRTQSARSHSVPVMEGIRQIPSLLSPDLRLTGLLNALKFNLFGRKLRTDFWRFEAALEAPEPPRLLIGRTRNAAGGRTRWMADAPST